MKKRCLGTSAGTKKTIQENDNRRRGFTCSYGQTSALVYEIYENPSLKIKESAISFEEPGMCIDGVIEHITTKGLQPDSIDTLYPVFELEVNNGWIVVEKDKVWFVSAIKPADWKLANLRYAAGMQKRELCVNRTQELNKALNIQE